MKTSDTARTNTFAFESEIDNLVYSLYNFIS